MRVACLAAVSLLACTSSTPEPDHTAGESAKSAAAVPVAATPAFPSVGLAVLDTLGQWCAAFPSSAPPLADGARVTIVFVEETEVPAWGASVAGARADPCPTAFAQPRWADYRAYDLALIDSLRPDAEEVPMTTLAVANTATWVRGSDRLVRADLDGDGGVEEARVCRADEGEHFTLWSGAGPARRQRAHEYFDWGAQVEPTCTSEESREDPNPGAP